MQHTTQQDLSRSHATRSDKGAKRHRYKRRQASHPLELLYKRGGLDLAQYEAGRILRDSFVKAELSAGTSCYSPLAGRNFRAEKESFEGRVLACMDVRALIAKAMHGQNARGQYILHALCQKGKTLADMERETGWEGRYVSERCKETLEDLAKAYELVLS